MNTLTEHLSHRPLRRGVRASLVVVLAILALAAASLVVAPIASAVEDVQPARVEGPTRLETAVATAERAYGGAAGGTPSSAWGGPAMAASMNLKFVATQLRSYLPLHLKRGVRRNHKSN